jgi:hypothetical protein
MMLAIFESFSSLECKTFVGLWIDCSAIPNSSKTIKYSVPSGLGLYAIEKGFKIPSEVEDSDPWKK